MFFFKNTATANYEKKFYDLSIESITGEKINFNITGNVNFYILKKKEKIKGNCYQNYILENEDELDILSTDKSVYGYLSISENFILETNWGSISTNTKAKIGANDGEKLINNQKINLDHLNNNWDLYYPFY